MAWLQGLYVQFGNRLDENTNAQIHALCQRLLQNPLPGVYDLFPGYVNLYIEFDSQQVSRLKVSQWVRKHLSDRSFLSRGRNVQLPVSYDGPDLPWVAQQTGLSIAQVVQLHSQAIYRVFAVGFTPGFPFMGPLHPKLYLPRRPTPRPRVPAHSLAIAVSQTAVYPLSSPGGWHLIGHALNAVYDPHRNQPFALEPGDSVQLVPSQGQPPPEPTPLTLLTPHPQHPVMRIEQPGLQDLALDIGRFGAARFGMASSGPLDARSARIANALVGNPLGTPLIEITLSGPVITAMATVVLAFAGFGLQAQVHHQEVPPFSSFVLRKGQQLRFTPVKKGARGYLAIAGGFDLQRFMGSCSTDLGGKIGRALQAGDLLGAAQPHPTRPLQAPYLDLPSEVRLRLLPGPQATPQALKALTSGVYRVGSANRMGLRLSGPKVPSGELISEATPLGAVQVTLQGDPIVLLNDRGRIGGYHKPAVVDPRDLHLAAQLRPGQTLRFATSGPSSGQFWFMQV